MGQGPQGHVQAGCAAGFGGRRQLGLGRGGLRGDGDLLAGPAAVALQRPAQGESARDGGGQQRARAENGTQAQRTAGRTDAGASDAAAAGEEAPEPEGSAEADGEVLMLGRGIAEAAAEASP